ncbi:hypothetical protein BpHYR1_037668 [Brachionus plicatilis]|uniref:Uncharacterized protein n=1 Tax=Brachionus plicatilis TaxID=10195 RepID=A0A3M7P6U1_BRAPC|nr:hypothetical protein BpHYR1_037668 [Brachionus plicatilis]
MNLLKFARCKTSTLSPDMDFDLIFGFYWVSENFQKLELSLLSSQIKKKQKKNRKKSLVTQNE